jgi:DnaK suppressor protein
MKMGKTKRDTASAKRSAEVEALLRSQRSALLEDYQRCLNDLNSAPEENSNEDDGGDQPDRISTAMMIQHLSRQIRGIDEALERVAKGEYGVCSDCGEAIAPNRLQANPAARRCLECQTKSERRAS